MEITNALSLVIIGGIMPFSISAVVILIFRLLYLGELFMAAGFIYLIVGVVLMVYMYRKISLSEFHKGSLFDFSSFLPFR